MYKKLIIYFCSILATFKLECMDKKVGAESKIEKPDLLKSNSMWQSLKDAICDKTQTEVARLEFFKGILSLRMDLLDSQDRFGMNLLMFACVENKPKFVEYLISLNAKLDLRNEFPDTPTALAIATGKNNQIVEMLTKAGAKE